MTLPVDARLPWDHLDVGLEDGFLLSEYRKAMKDRLSPPCGKPYGSLLHHNNLEDALADERKLVCYDCGVACDLTAMREDRLVALRKLGADKRPPPPLSNEERRRQIHEQRAPTGPRGSRPGGCERRCTDERACPAPETSGPGKTKPQAAFNQSRGHMYRILYRKIGGASFIAHLDTMRLLARMLRRAQVEMIYARLPSQARYELWPGAGPGGVELVRGRRYAA